MKTDKNSGKVKSGKTILKTSDVFGILKRRNQKAIPVEKLNLPSIEVPKKLTIKTCLTGF
jgi:hypothetical protein